jgi:hypothetical protein
MGENLKEEKMQILSMVSEGKISSEEGVKLLDALEEKSSPQVKKSPKWLKIRVYDPEDDDKVNITLPISLLNVGMKIANKFSPEIKEAGLSDDDLKEIFEAIKNGAEGKLVDIDGENGEKVEIIVE